jgi:hypothetical protein
MKIRVANATPAARKFILAFPDAGLPDVPKNIMLQRGDRLKARTGLASAIFGVE